MSWEFELIAGPYDITTEGPAWDGEGILFTRIHSSDIIATAGYRAGGPGPMIYVFSPEGEVLETHPTPADRPTNCTFEGPDLKTLYVTTMDGHLYRADTDRRGRLLYPPSG